MVLGPAALPRQAVSRRMDKKAVVHTLSGVLLSHEHGVAPLGPTVPQPLKRIHLSQF